MTVIDFKTGKPRKRYDGVARLPTGRPCPSPIMFEMYEDAAFVIGFHPHCFDLPRVDTALRSLSHGAEPLWQLYTNDRREHPLYSTYLVKVTADPGYLTEDFYTTLGFRLSSYAYRSQVRFICGDSSLDELMQPYQLKHGDGCNIDAHTKSVLIDAGITTIAALRAYTRERLCRVKGLYTTDIARIERSLAVRELFLRPTVLRPPVF